MTESAGASAWLRSAAIGFHSTRCPVSSIQSDSFALVIHILIYSVYPDILQTAKSPRPLSSQNYYRRIPSSDPLTLTPVQSTLSGPGDPAIPGSR